MVGAEVLKRTFLIRAGRRLGTAFTIDEEGKRYLISAGHIVAEGTESVEVFHAGRWLRIEIREIGERSKDIDMGVWAPKPAIGPCGRPRGDGSVAPGQDVWFLGFPAREKGGRLVMPWNELGASAALNGGYPMPFVRKGVVEGTSGGKILVESTSMAGFSGGPIVVEEGGTSKVVGVVSGYWQEAPEIMVGERILHAKRRMEGDPRGTSERVCEGSDECCPGRSKP